MSLQPVSELCNKKKKVHPLLFFAISIKKSTPRDITKGTNNSPPGLETTPLGQMLLLSPFHTCDSSNKAPEKHHLQSLDYNSSCAAASLESETTNKSSEKIYNTGPFTRRLRFCAALKTKKLSWLAALHHSAAALNERANAVLSRSLRRV